MKKKLLFILVVVFFIGTIGNVEAIENIKNTDITICVGSNKAIANNNIIDYDISNVVMPQIIDGETFVPLRAICEWFGAEVKWNENNKMVKIYSNQTVSQFSPLYNVVLVGMQALFLNTKPPVVQGRTLIPIDAIAKILGLEVYHNYDEEIVILSNRKLNISNEQFISSKKLLNVPFLGKHSCVQLDKLPQIVNIDYYNLSRNGKLFVSDEKGVLYLWKLKDDYELSKIRQDLYRYFIPNTVFVIANHNGVDELQQVVDGKTVKYSDTPQQITDQMFNYIFGEYQKLKYLNDVVCNGVDNSIKSKMDAYKSNITDISNILSGTDMEKELSSKYSDDVIKNVQKRLNELGKPVYVSGSYDWYTFEQIAELQKQNNIGVTGEIDDNTMKLLNLEGNTEQKKQVTDSKAEMQNRWDYFIKNASEGDILLFNTNERSQWGYNFHSAIIYKIYPETKTIRVLHARSEELGVGADMKMDYISFESLFTEDYWSRVLRISLYKVPNIQAETLKAVVNDAYEKYSGYSFGYGNWNGLKEILCAELIRDAYKKKGIKIDDNNDLMNQIKQVVKGDIAKALFVPDDIMMSNNVKMVSVWERVK